MLTLRSLFLLSLVLFGSSLEPKFLRVHHGGGANAVTPVGGGTSDYADLMKCIWNGTTVASCHQFDCKWCHSSMLGLCVTDKFVPRLDGTIFDCETAPATPAPFAPTDDSDDSSRQDDQIVTDDDDAAGADDDAEVVDDDAAAADDDDAYTTDDDANAIDDDAAYVDDDAAATDDATDDGHNENKQYMDDLVECMKRAKDACSGNTTTVSADGDDDLKCVWCVNTHQTGMCFSDAAAQNLDGPFYSCESSGEEGRIEW